jgi:hypothetical protein
VIYKQSTAQLDIVNHQAMMENEENDNAIQTVTLVSAIID